MNIINEMSRTLDLVRDYISKTDIEKFANDMAWPINCRGQYIYVEGKFEAMRKDFISFFSNLDESTQNKLLESISNI